VGEHVSPQIRSNAFDHLFDRYRATVNTPTNPVALLGPEGAHKCRFLVVVHSKSAQKATYVNHTSPGITEPQKQVPVERKAEARIDMPAGRLPDLASPEECFLRDIVSQRQHCIVMDRKDPEPDLGVTIVDQDPVAIDDVHFGVRRKKTTDVCECAGKQ
jgi:hypothetical protein